MAGAVVALMFATVVLPKPAAAMTVASGIAVGSAAVQVLQTASKSTTPNVRCKIKNYSGVKWGCIFDHMEGSSELIHAQNYIPADDTAELLVRHPSPAPRSLAPRLSTSTK